jgi:hypothetical protein
MSAALLGWSPGPGRSFEAHRDGLKFSVYWGSRDSRWYVLAEKEEEGAMGIADLEWTLDVSLPTGFSDEHEAMLAAEGLFRRVDGWFRGAGADYQRKRAERLASALRALFGVFDDIHGLGPADLAVLMHAGEVLALEEDEAPAAPDPEAAVGALARELRGE